MSDGMCVSLIPFCFFGDVGGMVHGQNPTPDLGVAVGFDQPLFQPIQLFMVHHCDVLDTTLKVEALLLERLKFIEQFVALLFLGAAREAAAPRPLRRARAAAAALAFGPVVAAVILLRLVGDRSDLRWPFHREAAPTFGLHHYQHPMPQRTLTLRHYQ